MGAVLADVTVVSWFHVVNFWSVNGRTHSQLDLINGTSILDWSKHALKQLQQSNE